MVKDKKDFKTIALIAAAGQGSRMQREGGKQLIELAGKSVIKRSVQKFQDHPLVDAYLVICSEEDMHEIQRDLYEFKSGGKCLGIIPGGQRRQDSVYLGLQKIKSLIGNDTGLIQEENSSLLDEDTIVLVHDGARCFVSESLITQAIQMIQEQNVGTAPVIPATDTVRILDDQGKIYLSPDRDRVVLMQTPQGAKFSALYKAYTAINQEDLEISDDIQALEFIKYPVHFYPGDWHNIKLTRPQDLALAMYILQE